MEWVLPDATLKTSPVSGRLSADEHHGRGDVLDVREVALLCPVPDDVESRRIAGEAVDQVVDDLLALSGSVDREEAHRRGGDPVELAVDGDVALGRELADPVRGDRHGRIRLVDGEPLRVPVHRGRRRVHQARAPFRGAQHLEEPEGRLEIEPRSQTRDPPPTEGCTHSRRGGR